jgi:hypothetical protein
VSFAHFGCTEVSTGRTVGVVFDPVTGEYVERAPTLTVDVEPIGRHMLTGVWMTPGISGFYVDDEGHVFGIR